MRPSKWNDGRARQECYELRWDGDGDADGKLRCKMQDGVGGDKMVG